jgi:hypothetical protein
MKFAILATLLGVTSLQVSAQSAMTATTYSPTVFSALVTGCAAGDQVACAGSVLVAPLASVSVGVLSVLVAVVQKEEIRQVQPDALHFLAGAGLSDALAEQLEGIREEVPGIADLSDSVLAGLIIKLGNIQLPE